MSAAALIDTARRAGVHIYRGDTGALRYRGDRAALERLLPEIRQQKPAILALLADYPSMHPDDAALVGAYLDHVGEDDPEVRRPFTDYPRGADAWQWLYAECVRLGVATWGQP